MELNQTKNCKTKNKTRSLTNQLKYIFELGGEEPLRLLSSSRDFFFKFWKKKEYIHPQLNGSRKCEALCVGLVYSIKKIWGAICAR